MSQSTTSSPTPHSPPTSPPKPSPPPSVSPPATPPSDAAALYLSPLPPTPPRTSSTVSSSLPSDLLPGISRTSFSHGLTALLRLRTRACMSPPSPRDKHSLYYGIHPPTIATKAYVERLLTHVHCSPSAFVVALTTLRRVAAREPSLALCPENLHRLLITAVVVAVKLLDDRVFSMRHYARVGGVPSPAELARLERQYLLFAGARVFVSRKSFLRTLAEIWRLRDHPLGAAERTPVVRAVPAPSSSRQRSTSDGLTASSVRPQQAALHARAETGGADPEKAGVEKGHGRASGNDGGTEGDEDGGGGGGGTGGREEKSEREVKAEPAPGRTGEGGKENAGKAGKRAEGDDARAGDQTPERRGGAAAAGATQAGSGAAAQSAAAQSASRDGEESLTVQTAAAEKGKAPVFGAARRSQRIVRRSPSDFGAAEDFSLFPTVEDDSGVLDDSDEDELERGLDDFEIDGDDEA